MLDSVRIASGEPLPAGCYVSLVHYGGSSSRDLQGELPCQAQASGERGRAKALASQLSQSSEAATGPSLAPQGGGATTGGRRCRDALPEMEVLKSER